METKNKLLEVKDLSIHYFTDEGVVRAVNNIDFELARGETMGLVGETGAGKTTTARGIMGRHSKCCRDWPTWPSSVC